MFTTRPELRGTFGMVASTHWLASGAGMRCSSGAATRSTRRSRRGSRCRSSSRTSTARAATCRRPVLGGARAGARGLRPGAGAGRGDAGRFAELGLDLIPGSGPLAAFVPGAFDAWMMLLRDFGTWEFADVMASAIGYARDGYPLVPGIRAAILGVEALFAASGRARRRSTCPRRARASGSATSSSPRPTSASPPRRERPRSSGSRPRATPSTAAWWPTRSTPGCARPT